MKKIKAKIFKRDKKYKGFFISFFLILCVLFATGMKKSTHTTLFLPIRMLLCEEQGKLVGVNLMPVNRNVYANELQQYGAAPQKGQNWHQLIADSVNDLVDGDVALEEHELEGYAAIKKCEISDTLEQIEITAHMDGIPASDDQYVYLFALESYENIQNMTQPVAYTIKDTELAVFMDWDMTTERHYLYDSFVLAIKKNGVFCAISDGYYITNPEILAENQTAPPKAQSIKGLLLDPAMLMSEELDTLSCKQIVYNIPLSNLLGESSDERFQTIYYTYHGKTYTFDGYVVAGYDGMFRFLRAKNMVITAIVLNNLTEEYSYLVHPLARDINTAPYYECNTAEEEGCETIEAIASFLGERYGSETNGLVSNWIIGNEINQREQWNYISYMSVEDYVKTYEKTFRIFYQAIRSHNANANVYFSIDQMWNSNDGTTASFYNGRDVLDIFNALVKKHGDIDWGLALHPYSYPLNKVDCWTDESDFTENAPIVSMKNVKVATDYMQKEQFLNRNGKMRSIILSEVGFTSTAGEDIQAAAFIYSYYMTLLNGHIDAFLVNRMTDSEEEIAQGLALGLQTLQGKHKEIWDIFAHIDAEDVKEYTDFALDIVGEKSWEDILP